jgi:uncharacterized protein YecA (UPF0149 family)
MEKKKPKELSLEQVIELSERIPEHVVALRQYWLDHPVKDAETRGGSPQPHRAPPKVGRNDPCPCGSGKKFKHCHGAGGVVH